MKTYTVGQFADRFAGYGVRHDGAALIVNDERIPAKLTDTFEYGRDTFATNGRGRHYASEEYIVNGFTTTVNTATRDGEGPMYRVNTNQGVAFWPVQDEIKVTFEVAS